MKKYTSFYWSPGYTLAQRDSSDLVSLAESLKDLIESRLIAHRQKRIDMGLKDDFENGFYKIYEVVNKKLHQLGEETKVFYPHKLKDGLV